MNTKLASGATLCRCVMRGFASLLAGSCIAPAAILAENFDSGTLPATLEIAGPRVTFGGGEALFPGASPEQRSYLRTVADDYYGRSFIAAVTVRTGSDIVFFGLGAGAPNPGFFYEPSLPSLNLRIHPNSIAAGRLDVGDHLKSGVNFIESGILGSGTHRLQLTWDAAAQTAIFAIDQNYAGGAFVADLTLAAFNGADNGFTDASTRIFFGSSAHSQWESSRPAAFDDLTITPVPEPTGSLLLVIGLGAFALARRGRSSGRDK